MQSRAVRAVEAEDSGEDEKEIGILSSAHNQENAGAAIAVALPAELELPPSPISHHIHEESSRIFLSGHRSRNCGSLTVRSTNAKDRHSKVRTAKGLRDRRVRLSAPTAIQFFEIQDRLGFDQPSKAVDWLIQHARSAIDELSPIAIAIAEPQKKQKQKDLQEKEKELLLRSFAHPSAGIDRHSFSRQISDDSSSKKSFRSNPNPNPNPNAAQSQSFPDSAPSCIHLHSSRLNPNPNPNPNVSQSQTLQQQQQQAGSVVLDGVARRAMARERARERVILRGKSRLSSSHMKRSAQELELDQAAEIAPSPPWKKLSTSAAVLLPMLPPPSPSPSPSPQTQTPPVKHLQVLSDLLLQSSSSSSSSSSSASKSQLRNPSRIPAPSPLQAQFRTESGASHGEVPCTARHRLDPDTGCCAAPPSPPKFNQNSEHHSPRGTLQSINLCNLSTIASATSTDCAITASDHSYIQVYHHHHHLLPQSPPSPFLHHHRHHMDYHQQQMQLLHSQNHMNAAAPSLLMMQGSEMPNSSLSPAPATATNSLYMHEADQLGLGRHSHHHHCILPPSDALSRRRSSMAGLIYLMQDQFLPKPDN